MKKTYCLGARRAGVHGTLMIDGKAVATCQAINPQWNDRESVHYTGDSRLMLLVLTEGTAEQLAADVEEIYRQECIGIAWVEEVRDSDTEVFPERVTSPGDWPINAA